MSRILARDTAARWRAYADHETYHQLRDGPRERETRWVIEAMRKYLPPEHVRLAYRIRDLGARSRGLKINQRERVDGRGNGAELALIGQLDARRTLAGFEAAARARLDRGGARCVEAIAEECTLAQTIRLCGYATGSHRSVRQLIQLTMLAAQDYADECAAQLDAWRRG